MTPASSPPPSGHCSIEIHQLGPQATTTSGGHALQGTLSDRTPGTPGRGGWLETPPGPKARVRTAISCLTIRCWALELSRAAFGQLHKISNPMMRPKKRIRPTSGGKMRRVIRNAFFQHSGIVMFSQISRGSPDIGWSRTPRPGSAGKANFCRHPPGDPSSQRFGPWAAIFARFAETARAQQIVHVGPPEAWPGSTSMLPARSLARKLPGRAQPNRLGTPEIGFLAQIRAGSNGQQGNQTRSTSTPTRPNLVQTCPNPARLGPCLAGVSTDSASICRH